ncbi:uncharacterized protein ARMOST_22238 [Armillaria ostoyae]|uniref:Uncharacterized protein n=1 Tax=Armillaria ostoyae TaxID=47428 RepID=A0A284SCB0_ARMOS|nr:uncharacterized protein ARMOST_22238 [Armillaria ostoyae]
MPKLYIVDFYLDDSRSAERAVLHNDAKSSELLKGYVPEDDVIPQGHGLPPFSPPTATPFLVLPYFNFRTDQSRFLASYHHLRIHEYTFVRAIPATFFVPADVYSQQERSTLQYTTYTTTLDDFPDPLNINLSRPLDNNELHGCAMLKVIFSPPGIQWTPGQAGRLVGFTLNQFEVRNRSF